MDSLPKPPTGYRWKIKNVGWGTKDFYAIKLIRFGFPVDSEEFLAYQYSGYMTIRNEETFRAQAAKAARKILDRFGRSLDYMCPVMVDEQHG